MHSYFEYPAHKQACCTRHTTPHIKTLSCHVRGQGQGSGPGVRARIRPGSAESLVTGLSSELLLFPAICLHITHVTFGPAVVSTNGHRQHPGSGFHFRFFLSSRFFPFHTYITHCLQSHSVHKHHQITTPNPPSCHPCTPARHFSSNPSSSHNISRKEKERKHFSAHFAVTYPHTAWRMLFRYF